MRPVFSIIIPVYNTNADMLLKCIGSVIDQTFQQYECIIVNDGSNSKPTLDCIDTIADQRFRIINQPNLGQGNARNRAISEATGKYIAFLDSDDFFDKNFLQTAFDIFHDTDADIVCTRITQIMANRNWETAPYAPLSIPNGSVNNNDKNLLINQFVIWNKIYKRSIFRNIAFPAIKNEDIFVLYATVLKAQNIYYTNKTAYNYIIHSASDVNSFRNNVIDKKSLQYIFDSISIFDMIFYFFKKNEKRYHISYFKQQLLQNACGSLKYRRNMLLNDSRLLARFDTKVADLAQKYSSYFAVSKQDIIAHTI